MSAHTVVIEQRLQDPPRVLMMPADEAVLIGLPVLMGLLSRNMFLGIAIGLVVWTVWRKLKGEGGLETLAAAAYWFLPSTLGIFKPLPDSAVETWEA